MKQIVNKFLNDIKINVISVLKSQNVLSKKIENDFNELESFLRKDEKNIFKIIDILAYSFLSEDTALENNDNLKLCIPQTLLDVIIQTLTNIKKSKRNVINGETSNVKNLVLQLVNSSVKGLLKSILTSHHGVATSIPKNEINNNNRSGLVLILVEYLYRNHLVNLPVINKNTVKNCIRDEKIISCKSIKANKNNSNDIVCSVIKYASTIIPRIQR